MSTDRRKILICSLFYIFMMLLGAAALGSIMMFCASDSIIFPIASVSMFAVVIIICVINVITLKRLSKKYLDENAAEMLSIADDMRQKARQDYVATERAVMRSKNRLILSKVLLSLYFSAMLIIASFGASDSEPLRIVSAVVGIIAVFIYPLPILDFFLGQDFSRSPEFCIDRAQYPLLFSVVDEAKKTLKCSKPYSITPVIGSGIAVSAYSGGFYVSLDVEETALLTRDELYQVMLHEIAHVINADTNRALRLERFSSQLDTRLGSVMANLFFSKQYIEFLLKKEAYYIFCNIFYEQNADKAINDYGNGQVYINGTAKTMMFSMYEEEYNPEIRFDIHKSERLPNDFLFYDLQVYERLLPRYEEKWNYVLTHRIQSRSDSHPTFSMRMQFANVTAYDYTQKETDERYIAEQKKLLRWGCDFLLKYTSEEFRRARAEYYLPAVEKIKKYRSDVEACKEMSVVEKCEYIELFFRIDRDECLKLCNDILDKYPRNAYANFYKGHLLAENLDKACVECLYTAAEENSNFAESAYNAIGAFACNTGDEELLNNYRSRADKDIVELFRRKKESRTLSSEENIRANALPKKDFDAVLNFILNSGKKIIDKIYSVSRGDGAEMRTFYYIEVSGRARDRDEFFDKVFEFLDMYVSDDGFEPSFSLFGDECDKKMKKIIKETPSSLIYSKEQ